MTALDLDSVQKWWKAVLAIGAASLLMATGTLSASAADDGVEYAENGAPIIVAEDVADPALVAEVEAVLQPLIAATSGVEFDAAAALSAGASEQDVSDFAEVFEAQGGTVVGQVDETPTVFAVQTAAAAAACAGYNNYRGFYASGPQWALNSCNTAKLISSIGLGAAAAAAVGAVLALAGAPHAGAVAGVIAAIIGLGAAFLVVCESWSSNSAIYLNGGIPGVVPPSCWGQ